jgi:AAA15 family ATPase/GTPase
MILNISIKNYRSFREEVTFSMVAESSRSKEDNVFTQSLAKGEDEVRLLNTALIYGANASGKSNLLNALFDIVKFVTKNQPKAGEIIYEYVPFKFEETFSKSPLEFSIEFIGKDFIKYKYELHFLFSEIVKEELVYWPNNKSVLLFNRIVTKNKDSLIHVGQLGASLNSTKIDIFKNQTILSKFGSDLPNDIISNVFIYFSRINILNSFSSNMMGKAKNDVTELFENDNTFKLRMNELMKFADTGLNGISFEKMNEGNFKFPNDYPDNEKQKILQNNQSGLFGIHPIKSNSKNNIQVLLPFNEESNGTRTLFTLGGKMLEVIDDGGILFVDELETSFHPFISKLLICLFQNKRINKKNAQLIFTTHDTNLMDRTLFRKDQIWFTEKNEYGSTELYSLQDFADVREDTPFEKWYLAGKFGGVPNLKSLESLFIDK